MSAADAIASHGPAKHWTFNAAGEPEIYPPDIPNVIDDDHHHAGEADDEWMTAPPCSGDTVARYYQLAGYPLDFRGPRGAYAFDPGGGPGDAPIPNPSTIPRSPLPFPLFSQAFTLIWMGGNFQGIVHRRGEEPFVPDWEHDEWGPAIWYGSSVLSPGLEDTTGGWFGIGRMDYNLDNNATNVSAYFGYGVYPLDLEPGDPDYHPYGTCMGLAAGSAINNWPSTNAKGLHAFVYDPTEPDLGFLWVDGEITRIALVNENCRAITIPALAEQPSPALMFATGQHPLGMGHLRTVYDDEGNIVMDGDDPVTEPVYPWRTGYGLLHNVALFDRAMPYSELRTLFAEINGQPPNDNPCSTWYGAGVVAILDVIPLSPNRWRFQADRSYHDQGGTLVRYDWFGGNNYTGDAAGPDPIYGEPGPTGFPWLGEGETFELEIPWADDEDPSVEIYLRVTDDFGAHGHAQTYVVRTPNTNPAPPWATDRSRF